jgi:hypothetical protein
MTFLLLVGITATSSHDHHQHIRRRLSSAAATTTTEIVATSSRCGIEDSKLEDHQAQNAALQIYNAKLQVAYLTTEDSNSTDDMRKIVVVPVCFHVFANREEDALSVQQMQDQLDALNRAYSASSCCDEALDWCNPGMCSVETGFRFAWALLDDTKNRVVEGRTVPNVTDPNACVHTIRPGLLFGSSKLGRRKGGASVLNVYWKDLPSYLGYSTLPWGYSTSPLVDGVTIRLGTQVGSMTNPKYNEGDTLVHETGHWLGLLHTFEGGCSPSDGVYDTAPEAFAYSGGCSATTGQGFSRNTCPDENDEENDPITNFMDYADDVCMFRFTPGQVHVMNACYNVFRLGIDEANAIISLTNGIPSVRNFLAPRQTQVFSLESTASSVTCDVTVEEGSPSFALNWGRAPYFLRLLDDCSNDLLFLRTSSCTARSRHGRTTIYASVRAPNLRAVQNMTILCTEKS